MRELALVVLSCCGVDWLMLWVQAPTAAARVAATAALTIIFMGIVSPYAARVWHNAPQRKDDLGASSMWPPPQGGHMTGRSAEGLPQKGEARDHHDDVQH